MDSDGLEQAMVGQARPDQGFIQPLIRMGTSQGAEVGATSPWEEALHKCLCSQMGNLEVVF